MIELKNKMEKSYIDYSLSVITDRALPDVRDGLKPVQRRILYDMIELGTTPDKPHRKCARIVGDTMGKYHPHGDSSIYGALVTMGKEWGYRYPLVDGHGNFGSIDGDGAAAMRYTEARLSKIAMHMVSDINKDTVDFIDNFDGTEKEPSVLPSRLPNIFLNCVEGIAVGMACNLASYNLNEVVDGICAYLDNEDITTEEILNYITAPDFATGCEIINKSDLPTILGNGVGKIKVRARYNVENARGNKNQLVFYEIPPNVKKEELVNKIIDLVNEERLDGIYDVRDETNKTDIRIVIELKKNMIPECVAEQLYLKTDLQINFNLNNNVLVNGQPKVIGLLEMIKEYSKFQLDVINRRTKFDLSKKQTRLHVLIGLCKALDNIDEVIDTIKSSKNIPEGIENLMNRYDLSELQAKSVIEIKLSRLTSLEKIKLLDEKNGIEEEVLILKSILESYDIKKSVLKDELQVIAKKLGDKRRTSVSNISPSSQEDLLLVAKEDVVAIYTQNNYIKTVKVSDYKIQNKGGQGIKNSDSDVKIALQTNTANSLLVVTEKGIMYKLNVARIPMTKNTGKGLSIYNLLPIEQDDKVSIVTDLADIDKEFVVFTTKSGLIKKSSTNLYRNFRTNGTKAITLSEGDLIIDISFVNDDEHYSMFSENGKVITFNISDIRPIGRVGQGVKGMSIGIKDSIVGSIVTKEEDTIALFSENGLGKKMSCSELTIQNRGGKGITCYKLTNKTGILTSVKKIKESDKILIIGDNKSLAINEEELSLLGRNTSGTILIRGSKILSTIIY